MSTLESTLMTKTFLLFKRISLSSPFSLKNLEIILTNSQGGLGGLGGIDKGLGCLSKALGGPGNGLGGLRKGSRGLEGLNKSFKVREFLVKTFE